MTGIEVYELHRHGWRIQLHRPGRRIHRHPNHVARITWQSWRTVRGHEHHHDHEH